jgi:hypothetical protein
MRASGWFRVTKICELQIHISSIPESGKGRGELGVGDIEFHILFLEFFYSFADPYSLSLKRKLIPRII